MQATEITSQKSRQHRGRITFSARHALLTLALALMAFDFRRESGDGGSLPVLITLAALASLVLIFFLKPGIPKLPVIAMLPALLYLFASVSAGIFQGNETYGVVAGSIPLVLFITTAITVPSTAIYGSSYERMISIIGIFAMASLVWKLIFGFAYYGLDAETVRYQIISGAMPLVFAYGVTALMSGGRKWMIPALIIPVIIVILSITRTYLIVFAAVSFAALICMPMSKIKATLVRLTALSLVICVVTAFAYLVMPEFFDRWTYRMTLNSTHGFDLTWATRMAETYSQYEQMVADDMRLLFGSGPTGKTSYSGIWGQQVFNLLGWDGMGGIGGYGHNFYFGALFVGGVISGIPFLLMILLWPLLGLKWARQAIAAQRPSFATLWGATAAIGYCSYGVFGGLFIDRAMCFYLGISFGLIFAGRLIAQEPKMRPRF